MQRYKHIIWDWNGTLLDDTWLCHELTNSQLNKRNIGSITYEGYRKTFFFPVAEFYRSVHPSLTDLEYKEIADEFHAMYQTRLKEIKLHKETLNTLHHVKKSGLSQSILSAHPHTLLSQIVDIHDLRSFFTDVIGDPAGLGQGKVGIGLNWIKNSPHFPKDVVLVGDTDHDAEVAEAMGIKCVLLSHGFFDRERLEPMGVPVFDSFEELKAHVFGA